jgi:hypothetical protein
MENVHKTFDREKLQKLFAYLQFSPFFLFPLFFFTFFPFFLFPFLFFSHFFTSFSVLVLKEACLTIF